MSKKIKIFVHIPEEKAKSFVKNELKWYDNLYRKMLVFEGSHLSFEYVKEKYVEMPGKIIIPENEATQEQKRKFGIKEKYRMRPKVEQVSFSGQNKNPKKLKKWFENYLNYNNSSAELEDEGIDGFLFELDEKERNDFVYALDRDNFRYRRE